MVVCCFESSAGFGFPIVENFMESIAVEFRLFESYFYSRTTGEYWSALVFLVQSALTLDSTFHPPEVSLGW